MPNLFGVDVRTVEEITRAFRRHGDDVRCTYRARYVWERGAADPYAGTALERPAALAGSPPGVVYPWEQVFLAAAACAGSDYPMLAAHLGVPLARVELVVEGAFDARGEFDGLAGFTAPPDAAPCFLSLHLGATLVSDAPEAALRALHRRALGHNMVLGALRGIPRTESLRIARPAPAPRD